MPKRQADAAHPEPAEGPTDALRDENARLASLATDAEARIAALQRDLAAARAEADRLRGELATASQPPAQAEPIEAPAAAKAEGEPPPPESEPPPEVEQSPVETAQPPEQPRESPPAAPDFRSLSAIDKIKLGLPSRTPIRHRRG